MEKGICFNLKFVWRVTYAHFIAYFIAGLFALEIIDYRNLFSTAEMSLLMRPINDPIISLGPILQIFRGLLIGVILLPIRSVILDEKSGFVKLGVLVLGLSLFSTIGPTPGSFEGYIYTIIPAKHQILGYPEAVLYVLLFCLFIWLSYKYEKRWIQRLFILILLVLSFLLIMGYVVAVNQ